jgi:hypothetical protein
MQGICQYTNHQNQIATQLLPKVRTGVPLTLRDFATLLQGESPPLIVQPALQACFKNRSPRYTQFNTSSQFFDVYYPLRQILGFDNGLAAYYDPNAPDSTTFADFVVRQKEIQLPDFQQSAEMAVRGIENMDTLSFVSGMQMLRVLPARMQDTLILRLYKRYISRRGNQSAPITTACFDRHFAQQFTINTQPEAPQMLADILDKGLMFPQQVLQFYQLATGRIGSDINPLVLRDSMLRWSKLHQDPQSIRMEGYEKLSESSRNFFDSEADFLGWMAIRLDSFTHIRSSIVQMLARSDDPRALYHLACLVARARWDCLGANAAATIFAKNMVNAIEERTGTEVSVADRHGATVAWSSDPVWMLHYGLYWEQHWDDYLWDARKNRFAHKANALSVEEEISNLFQLLASANDSIAIQAYQSLTLADPGTVLALLPEYTDLIRSPNPQVPPLKKQNLYAAIRLREWGKDMGFGRMPSTEMLFVVEQLMQEQDVAQRLALENQLIQSTTIQDLMVLDIYLINKPLNRDAAFSFSRILDQLYSKYWVQITNNTLLTRMYLKKAMVFREVQTTGTLHRYLNKFNTLDLVLMAKLEAMRTQETDPQIQSAIEELNTLAIVLPKQPEPPLPTEAEISQLKTTILENQNPEYQAINSITMSEQFDLSASKTWLHLILTKWPSIDLLTHIALADKLDPVADIHFFQDYFNTPSALTETWRWFAPGNEISHLEKLQAAVAELPLTEQGGYLFQLLRAEPMKQWLLTSGHEIKETQPILHALSDWLEAQDYLSEYDEAEIKLLLLLLEYASQPIENKLAVTCALQGANQKAVIQGALLGTISYADLNNIRDFLPCIETDAMGEPLTFKTLRELGLPPIVSTSANLDFNFQKPLNEAITEALKLLGIEVLSPAKKGLNYELISEILEQERIIPLTGSGGNYRDWYVFSVIKLLEFEHKTNLGFHPKLNENQTFFNYNSAERAEAWLTWLREHELIPQTGSLQPRTWQ